MLLQFRAVCFLILVGLFGCHLRQGVIHYVGEDESLLEVSHLYAIDVTELLRANPSLDPLKLKSGQKIFVPGAETRRMSKVTEEQIDLSQATEPESESKIVTTKEVKPRKVKMKPGIPTKPERQESVSFGSLGWPIYGKVIYPFGMRNHKMHNGMDIKTTPGAEVKATQSGKVVYRGHGITGYGDLVIIRHADLLFSVYAYLGEILVSKDQGVKKGDVIARAIRSASTTFVHFELRKGKTALDPLKFLSEAKQP